MDRKIDSILDYKSPTNIIFCVSEGFPNTVEGDDNQKLINGHQVNEIHD